MYHHVQHYLIWLLYISTTISRLLNEVYALEEREYDSMLGNDGKPKMKFDTTSGYTYKGIQPQKQEEPAWANKTMVSLGRYHEVNAYKKLKMQRPVLSLHVFMCPKVV